MTGNLKRQATDFGSGLASSIVLLGREYYQTTFGGTIPSSRILPFAIHVTSDTAKRAVLSLSSDSSLPSHSSRLSMSDLDTASQSEEPFTPELVLASVN
ncbi:hypothetical protein EDC04DRAFT_2905750 [Pisolithus marmoratus]|nr:hypothetical protein EDC04DRAFT_2905750 [Pisolithus marmoratus]